MRNTLGDLNMYLFEQLERLNNEELKGNELAEEIGRARAIGSIAKNIINNGNLVLEARKLKEDHINADAEIPKMLEG